MSTITEQILGEVMDQLVTCLCEKLTATDAGLPCFCGMYPGDQAVADRCSCNSRDQCGQAWVRLETIQPWDNISAPSSGGRVSAGAPCVPILGATIELGVFRCQPTNDAQGKPPTAVALTNAAMTQVADAGAMVAALNCCEGLSKRPTVLGRYSPRSSGGCGGAVWPVSVQLVRV